MAAAVLFGAASCAKEDISSSIANGEQVEVTFTANLPELGTRAESYGNASAVDVVYVKVYDANTDEFLSSLTLNEGYPVVEKKATVNIALVKGMKYNIVFWAQSRTCGCYTFNNDKTISVSYAGAEANDDNRDAFYAYVNNFDPVAPAGKDQVKLYRPFAQLNAATLDKQDVINSGINFESLVCEVEVVGACTKLDLTDGTASDPTTATFAAATIPAKSGETLPGKSDYDYLSMNYVLVNGKQLVEATYTISGARTAGVQAFELANNTYTNVPLQSNYRTNILGKLITKSTDFYVEIKPAFDNTEYEVVAVNNTAELQDALDNAVAGTTIELQPGVNYGAVVIRPVAGAANTITDCDYLVYRNEMLRKVENLTIVGAVGAKVEAIKVQAGHIEGSTGYVVDIKNLVIDGVEFSDTHVNPPHSYAAPIFFDLSYINVDGLTVKNCKLIGNNSNMNFVYLYGSGNPSNSTFVTAAKNVTIANNIVDGIARLCELRQANNVTITGNTIKNTALHGMLLPVDGGTYSGNVTIQNNTAEGIRERFVRADGTGDAVVVIKDNVLINYQGTDADYIKVTNGTNVTIENNTFAQSATVIVPENNTEDVVVSANDATNVTVPANEAEAGANYKVVISDENRTTDNITGKTTVDFDLTLYKNGEEVSGDVIYTIAKNIGADLFITGVTHNGNALTEATTGADQTYTYNSAEGVLTIYTKSFSPFAVTYIESKDYVRKLNAGHNKNSTISVSTGSDFLPIAAVNPEIYGYSVYDGDTRIANAVTFRFSKVKKETINENSYKVSLNLAVLDENGNELEIKDGRMNPYITSDPREHLKVYMNLIEVPAGYAISQVKVGGTELTLTLNTSGNCATGEYWVGSNPKDLYFQSRTAGLIEVTVAKAN